MFRRDEKMEKLLELFHDVLRDDEIKDITFTEKSGYIELHLAMPGEVDTVVPIETPEEMAETLMDSLRYHFFELAQTTKRLPKYSDRCDSEQESVMTPEERSIYNHLIASYKQRIDMILEG